MNFNSGVPRFESKKRKRKDRLIKFGLLSENNYCYRYWLSKLLSNMCTNHNAKQFCSDVFITVYHHQCNLYSRHVKQLGKSDP